MILFWLIFKHCEWNRFFVGHWLHHSFLFFPYFEELHYFSHLLRSVIEGVENRKEMISCLIEQSSWFVTSLLLRW